MQFILFCFIVVTVLSVGQRLANRQWIKPEPLTEERKEEIRKDIKSRAPKEIFFHGGPLNGKTEQVAHESPFGFQPYYPDNEEERTLIGEVLGRPIYQPQIAYYRRVTDHDYFYVRDVTEEEVQKAAATGREPEARVE